MAWWDRTQDSGEPSPSHGLRSAAHSVYEDRAELTTEGDDEVVWHRVGELDPFTGAWRGRPDWSMGWHPFPGRRLSSVESDR
jgi:hypothetical protein